MIYLTTHMCQNHMRSDRIPRQIQLRNANIYSFNLDVVDVGLQIPYHVDKCIQRMWHCFLIAIARRVGYAQPLVAREEEIFCLKKFSILFVAMRFPAYLFSSASWSFWVGVGRLPFPFISISISDVFIINSQY